MKYLFYICIACLFSCNKEKVEKKISNITIPPASEVKAKIPTYSNNEFLKFIGEAKYITYIVQPGDTFSEVCEFVTSEGSVESYLFHAQRNQLKNPDFIIPGEELYFILYGKQAEMFTLKYMESSPKRTLTHFITAPFNMKSESKENTPPLKRGIEIKLGF